MKTKKKHYGSYLILMIFGLYMIFPLLSTFFYSTSTSWSNTILPEDFTFQWFVQLMQDPNFISAVITIVDLNGYHVSRCFSCHGSNRIFSLHVLSKGRSFYERSCPDALCNSRSYFGNGTA